MRLTSISYCESIYDACGWSLSGLTLGNINLVVGKNATGKTRTLNAIHGLAQLVTGRQRPADRDDDTYDAIFQHDGRNLRYELTIENRRVVREVFTNDGVVRLTRGANGVGQIYHTKLDAMIDFQTPDTETAAVARRDTLQHPFLEPLHAWGDGVRYYQFGTAMGQDLWTAIVKDGPPPDPRDAKSVVGLLHCGLREYGDRFVGQIRTDMQALGYEIESIGITSFADLGSGSSYPAPEASILYVKEPMIEMVTKQRQMSQGMFRALAVIIHVAYATIADRPHLIVIDDIGEGLDFERSCKLINLLRQRAQHSQIQLLLATNDRNVMNGVPLEEWAVLQRKGSQVKVLNHQNSPQLFDDFRFTGLSNFSFLEMDFANAPPMELATP